MLNITKKKKDFGLFNLIIMKEFDPSNITGKSNLKENNSISSYMGHGAQQNYHAYEVFYNFLKEVKPKRILEIGTGMGGFTMSLKLFIEDLELETNIRSYDINGSFMYKTLIERGIDVRLDNIFTKENGDLFTEVINYVQSEGTTVVLCDGGNKIFEFNLLSEFIKPGDYIFAHDYAKDDEYFNKYIKLKLWNWLEIQDRDIQGAVEKHNLKPYMAEEFQKAVWVCKIKE